MNYNISVIAGDGIGPDITAQAILVLERIGTRFGHTFTFSYATAGGCAIDAFGEALPQATIDICRSSDSILLGAVGGPKWDTLPGNKRPETALLGLRSKFNLFANFRPAFLFPQLADACPLKQEIMGDKLDLLIVRELTGGLYFGKKGREQEGSVAYDTLIYSTDEIKRVLKTAFEAARKRKKKLTVVDKANILETSRLWREVVTDMAKDYKDISCDYMYVDNCAMQLIKNPNQFDVIVTENMFGDILSDEASMLTGSIGMLASASLGDGSFGMYEPIHGSAPDIAGQDKANPIATIMSVKMMLQYSFDLLEEGKAIEDAVLRVLDKGYRTADIYKTGQKLVGTVEMGKLICEEI